MPLLSNMELNRHLIGGLTAGKKWASGTMNLAYGSVTLAGLTFEPMIVIFYSVDATGSPVFITFINKKHNPTKLTQSVMSQVSQGQYDTYDSTNYGIVNKASGIITNPDGITFSNMFNANNIEWYAIG